MQRKLAQNVFKVEKWRICMFYILGGSTYIQEIRPHWIKLSLLILRGTELFRVNHIYPRDQNTLDKALTTYFRGY